MLDREIMIKSSVEVESNHYIDGVLKCYIIVVYFIN